MKKSITINNIVDLFRFVKNCCDGKSIVYRGQPIDRDLLPKIARVKLISPKDKSERLMFDSFTRMSHPHLTEGRKTQVEMLAIAQHHGMATRLLDWSNNPMVALWFAVDKAPAKDEKGNVENGVLWALDISELETISESETLDPFEINRTMIFRPKHIVARIISQFGIFTIHHYDHGEGGWVALNRNREFQNKLTKVIIPSCIFHDLRKELDRFGFNPATMFPDLEGVCRNSQWQHSYLDDEGPARLKIPLGVKVVRYK